MQQQTGQRVVVRRLIMCVRWQRLRRIKIKHQSRKRLRIGLRLIELVLDENFVISVPEGHMQ